MMRSEGNKQRADYLFNVTWFEYYWGIVEYNRYQDKMKEAMEKSKTK